MLAIVPFRPRVRFVGPLSKDLGKFTEARASRSKRIRRRVLFCPITSRAD
jgi:hypothetical protein